MKIRIKPVDVSDIGLIGRDFYYVQVRRCFKWKTLRKCLGQPAIFVYRDEAEKFLQRYVEDRQDAGVKVTLARESSKCCTHA